MALKWKPRDKDPQDPDGLMAGRCPTCKADVKVLRRDCRERGGFLMAACPTCHAAVSVLGVPKVVEKGFQDQ